MDSPSQVVGPLVKDAIQSSGSTFQEVAYAARMSKATLFYRLSGRDPKGLTIDELHLICVYLGRPIADFIKAIDHMSPAA